MKQRIYNGHPLEFFNSSNDKKAEIKISGSDLILNPLDSSGTVIIGEAGTINDIEVGAVGTAVDFTFLGGGTLTSNGGTLTIGASGDTIDLSNTTIAAISASVFTGSFVGDGTNLINVVPDLSSYSGNVGVTGNLTVTGKITAEEFHTEFVSASIIYNSGSTKFGDTHDDVHDFTGSINVKASGSTRSVVIDSVSGFGRVRASSASFFLGGGSTTLIQAQNDFVPDGDSSRDLGSTSRYWAELYVDSARLGNDSSHTHSVTGSIDMKTGNLLINMNKGGYIEADYDDSTGSLKFADGTRAKFGTGNDLHIYHDGANSYIHESGTGDLYLRGGNDLIIQDSVGNTAIHINDSNTVELMFGGHRKLQTLTNGVEISGSLGVGTNNPDHLVHVEFADTDTSFSGGSGGAWGSQGIRIENTVNTADTMAMLHFRNNDADIHVAGIRQGTDDSDLGFFFEGTEKIRFTNNGNVGIGTTTPVAKLEINGGTGVATAGAFILRQTGNTEAHGMSITSGHATSTRIYKDSNGVFKFGPSSNSDAFQQALNGNITIDGTIDADDITIDDWGSVSASLAAASGGGTIDGSGAANRLAIWSDADTLTSDTDFTVNADCLFSTNAAISNKLAVKSATTHSLFDFYNNGTSYFNGDVTVDANFTQTTGTTATFSGDVTIGKTVPTLTFNNLAGGGLDPILEASHSFFKVKTTSITPFTINLSNGSSSFDGRVGINTATPAAGIELHVNGEIRVDGTDGVATRKIRSGYFSSTTDIAVASGLSGSVLLQNGNNTVLTISGSNRESEFAGSVNITGSSAGTFLRIEDGSTGAPIKLESNNSGEAFIFIGNENSSIRRTGGDLNILANGVDMLLSTNNGNTKTMFLSTGHNVGIGTTNLTRVNSSAAFFQPDEDGRFLVINSNSGSFLMLETNATGGGDQVGGIYFNKTGNQSDAHIHVAGIDAVLVDHGTDTLDGGELRFFTKVAGAGDTSHHMVLDQLGKLGIGQNINPDYTLHVSTDINEIARFESTDDDGLISIGDDNDKVYIGYDHSNTAMSLGFSNQFNSDENLTLKTNGRVGIGTTAPDRRLHVQTSDDVVAHFESTDGTARIDVSDNTVHTRIGAQASQSFFGPYTSYTSTGVFRIYSASFNASDDGYASFGSASPSVNHKLRIGLNPNTSDDIPQSGVIVDLNLGGSSALSGDRNYRGFISDIDSTATGGDTSNESRLYGFYADVNDQGSSDLNYGFYAQVQNRNSAGHTITEMAGVRTSTLLKHTSGSITNGYGAYFSVNATQDGGTLGSLYGIRTEVTTGNTDKATDNAFAGYFRNIPGSDLSADWGHARGVYAEVQWDPSTTLTNGTAVQANIDSNAGTITNAYQFKGATTKAGTISNSYGIYSDGADKHYFSGKVGVGTTSPVSKLDVKSSGSFIDGISLTHSGNTVKIASLGQESGHGSLMLRDNSGNARIRLSTTGSNTSYFNAGNVIIGGTTPDDVGGTSKLSVDVGTGQGSFRLQNGGTDGVYFRRNTTGGKYQLQTTLGNSNAGVLSLQSYAGQVGIGTTSTDTSFLATINASDSFIVSFKNNQATNPSYGVNRFISGSTVIANYGWRNQGSFSPQVLSGNGNGEFFIRGDKGIALISNNTASISISEAADVVMGDNNNTPRLLIGTGSAATNSKIHIHGDNNYIRFSSNAGTLAAEIGNDSSGDGVMLLREDSDNTVKIKLYAEQSGSSFIDNDGGKFGLFTSSPQAELHVVGDAIVTGKLTAQEFHTEFVSASILYESGSTKFGDTSDDVHDFTGSVNIKDGNIDIKATDPTITLFDTAGANTDPNGRIVFKELAGVENFDINYNGSSDRLEFRGRVSNTDGTDLIYINRDSTTPLNVLGGGTFTGNVSINGQLNVGDSNADILQVGLKSVVAYGENTDVDTGTETIKELAIATYQAAFFDFVIKKGSNIRAGTLTAAHDGTNVEFNEVSTVDLGDTTDVKLSVDISSGNMRLRATTLSNDWSVKAFVRAIKV